jgi:hypothetical protein
MIGYSRSIVAVVLNLETRQWQHWRDWLVGERLLYPVRNDHAAHELCGRK